MPPIQSTKNKNDNVNLLAHKSPHARKGSLDLANPPLLVGGGNGFDTFSESRSIYKLDPNFSAPPKSSISGGMKKSSNLGVSPIRKPGAAQGPSVDQLFQKLRVEDKSLILDKIHQMRMRAFDKRGYENLAKPHMPSYNPQEKEKIIEQYYMAKR